MRELVDRAWNVFQEARTTSVVVNPSMPILYFGNRARYESSPIRIITVGLNPSDQEFPQRGPDRFAAAVGLNGPPAKQADRNAYLRALDGYFDSDTHYNWFANSFGGVLNGMDASYFDTYTHTALHTDICSPIATNLTWSKLKGHQSYFSGPGIDLWHDLVRKLQPHVIIISVARNHLDRIKFQPLTDWQTIHSITTKKDGAMRKQPYVVKARDFDLGNGSRSTLVFAQAAQRPFGTLSNPHRTEVGEQIRRKYHGR